MIYGGKIGRIILKKLKMNKSIFDIKKNGYFRSDNSNILSDEDLNKLVNKIDGLFEIYEKELDYSSNAPVLRNLHGRDKEIDKYLEKILTNDGFKNTFENILGSNYKIWEISCRYSLGYDKGLEMHSDGKGQMNFVMYLNDQINPQGVTSIWTRSHLIYRLADYVSWRNMSFIWKYFTKPLTAKKGSYFVFLNKTWHGRLPKNNNNITKALFFGCYCEGSTFDPIFKSENYFNQVEEKELKKRLKLNNGQFNKQKGTFFIDFMKYNRKNLPFALKIEKLNSISLFKNLDQFILIFLIELFLFIPYRIYRLRSLFKFKKS